MKIAIIHDWFNNLGGAEKVVKEMVHCYPDADIFCLVDFFDDEKRKNYLNGKKTTTSFIQYLPFARRYYRLYLPFFPMAIASLNLKKYDLILSSSSCVAKGIRKHPDQLHICYCHSPVRYAWDLKEEYLQEVKGWLSKKMVGYFLAWLRKWDYRKSQDVDYFIANSENVKCRIRKNYDRESTVIYPPIDLDKFGICEEKHEYYLTVNRLVTYKRTELLVKAFRELPGMVLEIIGEGPAKKKLEKMAPENVRFLGFVDDSTLVSKMKHAKAFSAFAHEDFGITVVEAQACGTPVIVPRIGGYRETVVDETGVFVEERSVEKIVNAFKKFDGKKNGFRPKAFTDNVLRFHKCRFHKEFKEFVDEKYGEFRKPG